jgi:hypothetical protein
MNEGNYYKVVVKTVFEDSRGREKVKKDNYVVLGVNPTDVEKKMVEHLSMSDMEIVAINLMNIVEVVK